MDIDKILYTLSTLVHDVVFKKGIKNMENWLQTLISKIETISKILKDPIQFIAFFAVMGFLIASAFQTNPVYLIVMGVITLLLVIIAFLSKQHNQKIHSQNKLSSNKIVDNLNLQEKLDLQNNQIDVLKEVLTNAFDVLHNISNPLISKNELNEAFVALKNNNIGKAKEIFNRLLQISITSNNYENKASNLRHLAILIFIECSDLEEALPFYIEAKRLMPKHPENEKLDIIFEKYLKIFYPVQDNGNINLGRIKPSSLIKNIEDMEKLEYSQLKLYIKFGLSGKIAQEPKKGDPDMLDPRYVIEDKNSNIIKEISFNRKSKDGDEIIMLLSPKAKKSRRYSLKELKASLDV